MEASQEMITGYLETARFADCPEESAHYLGAGARYDRHQIGVRAFSRASRDLAARDCAAFLDGLSNEARELADTWDGGSDLWYTRNGHGVGFWESDRGWGECSQELADKARNAGERYVSAGRYLSID